MVRCEARHFSLIKKYKGYFIQQSRCAEKRASISLVLYLHKMCSDCKQHSIFFFFFFFFTQASVYLCYRNNINTSFFSMYSVNGSL